jgi:predicted Zn finger-like uncharacterized protein
MLIEMVDCPACGAPFIVDHNLWSVGTVRLRCVRCRHYFLPEHSPRSMSVEEASNAGAPIEIWEPAPDPS